MTHTHQLGPVRSLRLLFATTALVIVPLTANAQELPFFPSGIPSSSIGLRAGYAFPQGTWMKSRVAPQIDLFGSNFAFEGDLSFRVGRTWAMAVGGGYMEFSSRAWEQYAMRKGDTVSVSTSAAHLSFMLRPHLRSTGPDLVSLELGAVGLFASGNEVVNGELYTYDFFDSFRIGFQGGLEYDRIIADGLAFTLRGTVIVVPGGMRYADGETRTVVYLPVVAGIRFLL